ncbi:MAG: AbrB/MazE/SpoVT family DNA-binding domain-containing protein [Candidatus Nitrosocosmicus sp.]|nr:AbrB/MazE/SpoVT family DNA-binding domain-containing protein [Candidatus Nitrosocosmicus sp.]
MKGYIHRINGILGKTSLTVVLPKDFLKELQMQKGDFVKINKDNDKIVIEKLEV